MAVSRKDQKDATRERLVSAGATIFAADGVQGARIADIAREAGVAMGTLYTHFADKEALFLEVMRAGKQSVLEGLALARESSDTREGRDRAAMEGVVAFAQIYGPLFRLMLSRGAGDPVQREVVDAITALRVAELIEGQAEGWARADLDPEAAARCEVGAVFHLLDWWIDNPGRFTPAALVEQLCSVRRLGIEGAGPLAGSAGDLPPATAKGSMS
ncbi:TetR/AcrR family transcriptional regulator [Maricaulis sp.]|uniref:TetR/AcrR family transcriptional regulator n=1 Tax=Maricaulis sp. TaxID=1486257 RepID=UPI003A8E14A5